MSESDQPSPLSIAAAGISRSKKEQFLKQLSEHEFRDQVIRPLFFRLDLKDGRDLCGPEEEGKDAVFVSVTPFGMSDVWVVQTKKGNLTLAGNARDNLITATVQLRTASQTTVAFTSTKEKRLPAKVVLCASGKINAAARKHIVDELRDPRLAFFDSDDLIPQIDSRFPELWLGIDTEVMPYMRALRKAIEESSESVAITELLPGASPAATDGMFVELYLWRNVLKLRKHKGQVEQVPEFVELKVTEVVKQAERLVLILGEAGSGKSTSIRRLAYVLADRALALQPDFQIPVLLRAVDLAKAPGLTLVEAALAETRKLAKYGGSAFGSEDLARGRLVLLIDALDEVASDSERKSVLEGIKEFNSAFPSCLVILTSREYAFVKNLPQLARFTRYRVEKISFKQAEQLVDRLSKRGKLPVNQSKELIRRLEQIHGMELNPLLVTVFAATTEYARKDIPANITELFKKFTEIMLGRWDATKGFAHQFHAPLKDFVLTRIAFEMHLERLTDLPIDEFRARVAAEFKNRGHQADVDQLLDEILNRSGLVRIVGDRVEFRHLLIQEFYAGRGIPSEDLIDTFIFDDWWRRAVVFYFGDRPTNSAALARARAVIPARGAAERFTATGTLGLAIQASYLVPLVDKVAGFTDVINNLSEVMDSVVEGMAEAAKFPLSGFLMYYLTSRDAVALTALDGAAANLIDDIHSAILPSAQKELREFWIIAGLLEAGLVTDAEALVRKFRPSDPRLLLAIHLGCSLIQHVRVSTDEQRKSARRICERVEPGIGNLGRQVFTEFRTHLIEVRRGEIAAIEPEEIMETDRKQLE